MIDKDKQAKAQDCDCALCMGESKVWMAGLLGLVVGLLVMYLAYPAILPSEPMGPGEAVPEEEFELDMAKADEIAELLSASYLLGTGIEEEATLLGYNATDTHVTLYYEMAGQEIPVVISTDYVYLYQDARDYSETRDGLLEARDDYIAQLGSQPDVEEGFPQTGEPQVLLAVMSNCPFGNVAENAIVDVVGLLEDEVSFNPVYILSTRGNECDTDPETNATYCSLHGNYELDQDVRERIVYNMYGGSTWAQYAVKVNTDCFDAGADIETCWKSVADELGLNSTEIGETFNSDKYAILAEEMEMSNAMAVNYPGAFGSPTLEINGVKYQGGRSAEAYKAAICSAFSEEPEGCATELSEAQAASSGSCG
jgi:hypothetical protein